MMLTTVMLAQENMKEIQKLLCVKLLITALWLGMGFFSQAVAQEQLTIKSINKINGLHETFASMERLFRRAPEQFPEPKSEKLMEAWAVAVEGIFDADRLVAAAEAEMEGKFTEVELRDLYTYFSSPLGRQVTALEIAEAESDQTDAREAEGNRLWKNLETEDPDRLALYVRMIEGLDALDTAEVVALNTVYGLMVGMFAEAGVPVTPEATRALIKAATADLRQDVEKTVRASAALTYRDLSNEDLEKYVEFLETPAGARYYSIAQQALDSVLSRSARELGSRLVKAVGTRKA